LLVQNTYDLDLTSCKVGLSNGIIATAALDGIVIYAKLCDFASILRSFHFSSEPHNLSFPVTYQALITGPQVSPNTVHPRCTLPLYIIPHKDKHIIDLSLAVIVQVFVLAPWSPKSNLHLVTARKYNFGVIQGRAVSKHLLFSSNRHRQCRDAISGIVRPSFKGGGNGVTQDFVHVGAAVVP
jgi:hypothetical protein